MLPSEKIPKNLFHNYENISVFTQFCIETCSNISNTITDSQRFGISQHLDNNSQNFTFKSVKQFRNNTDFQPFLIICMFLNDPNVKQSNKFKFSFKI